MLNTISNKAKGMSNGGWGETKRKSVVVPKVVLAHITRVKWLENNAADGQTMVRWGPFPHATRAYAVAAVTLIPVGTPL